MTCIVILPQFCNTMTCIVILPQLRILSPVMPVGTKSQLWPKFFFGSSLTVLSWNPQKSGTRTGIFSLNILMASVSPVIYNLQPFCKDICTSLYLIRFTICIFCIMIVRAGTFWCLVTSLRGPRRHLHNVYSEPDISSAENWYFSDGNLHNIQSWVAAEIRVVSQPAWVWFIPFLQNRHLVQWKILN